MINLAGLFVLVVGLAMWVFLATSLLEGLDRGGRASVLETVTPVAEPSPAGTPAPIATPGATATPGPAGTPAPTPATQPQRTYTVAAGDNLTKIANTFGVTLEALQRANRIDDPSSIRVGQVLIIPPR
ncbi:MAG: LysM peptidoglycan-binding domain-containing protein [Chloroflexi bacterium]|nr:LysM peptidoglycan-binding domain-containing protein [Chloroflexota bacterium]